MTDPIVKTVFVNCSPEHAFKVFVSRISDWWPVESHSVSAGEGRPAQSVTIERTVGGSVYETKYDGSRADWGRVLTYEQGKKLTMTWHPGNNSDNATLVEVTFTGSDTGCDVTLTHSGWDVWGSEAPDRITRYTEGWGMILGTLYTTACQST